MIPFYPSDPFPDIDYNSHSYFESQEHSALVDNWLGLNVSAVEYNLNSQGCRVKAHGSAKEHQQLWIGLASKSLLTPYTEIRNLLMRLSPKPGETMVDLGAGYGRMGFVIGRHYPEIQFIGYEYVGERVKEGQRCLSKFNFARVKLEHSDLSDPLFSPAAAEYYFLYDFGSMKAVEKTLHDLRKIASCQGITVVGRGRQCRDLIERRHPWLSDVVKPDHLGHYSIYRSRHDSGCPNFGV